VKKGDNLSNISAFYEVQPDEIVKSNRIEDPDLVRVGQTLTIPMTRKWIRLGTEDTLESLAKKYNTSVELLIYLNPKLKEVDTTYVGQQIAVPQKMDTASTKAIQPVTKKENKRTIYIKQPGALGSFEWPIRGQITSSFGWRQGRQHKGIDIWNSATSSCVIRSALGGTVVKAGYSGAYGNLVVIAHPGGWETYYAHMSRITVSRGQVVDTGQMVGYMGRTGDATGYHLHFEVRREGQVLNPLVLLER
jgi:murein DD-endopeptidase MepM/ murein hydrolase activator NlpD